MSLNEQQLLRLRSAERSAPRPLVRTAAYPAPRGRLAPGVTRNVSTVSQPAAGPAAPRPLAVSDFPIGQFLYRVSTNIAPGGMETLVSGVFQGPVWIEEVTYWGDSATALAGVSTTIRVGSTTTATANSAAEGEVVHGPDSGQSSFLPISTVQVIRIGRIFAVSPVVVKIYHSNGGVAQHSFLATVSFRTRG